MKRTISLCLIFTSLYVSLVAVGQAGETKANLDPVPVAGAFRGNEPLGINVDFSGGSISKFLAAVAKADGVSFTIIFNGLNQEDSADFAKVELPACSLRNVNLLSIFQLLVSLLEPRGFELMSVGVSNPNSWVCTARKIPVPREKSPAPQIQFLSYQLAPFLQSQSVDDIVEAVHTAWELDPSHVPDRLRVKFHPGTSILLVSGPQEAINIARNVLVELKRPPEQKTATRTTESTHDKK